MAKEFERMKACKLLGVSPRDDAATVRRAWRALVRTYHPDQFTGDKDAASKRLAELNAAYDAVLMAAPAPKEVEVTPEEPVESDTDRRAREMREMRMARQDAANRAAAQSNIDLDQDGKKPKVSQREIQRAASQARWDNASFNANRAAEGAFASAKKIFATQPRRKSGIFA